MSTINTALLRKVTTGTPICATDMAYGRSHKPIQVALNDGEVTVKWVDPRGHGWLYAAVNVGFDSMGEDWSAVVESGEVKKALVGEKSKTVQVALSDDGKTLNVNGWPVHVLQEKYGDLLAVNYLTKPERVTAEFRMDGLVWVAKATSKNDNMPLFEHVQVDVEEFRVPLVQATDRYRIHRYTNHDADFGTGTMQFTLHRDAILLARKLSSPAAPVVLTCDGTSVEMVVSDGLVKIRTAVFEGRYPNMQQLMERGEPAWRAVLGDPSVWQRVAKQVDWPAPVRLSADGASTLQVQANTGYDEALITLSGDAGQVFRGEFPDYIGFNARFLAEMTDGLQVGMSGRDAVKPAMFEGPLGRSGYVERTGLLMPVKIPAKAGV